MPRVFRENNEMAETEELDEEKIKAISDETRRKILEILAKEECYPLEISRKLDIEKQKTYYHFEKLKEAGLIEESRKEEKSGGSATYYKASAPSYLLDLEVGGEKVFNPSSSDSEMNFFSEIINSEELDVKLVVGSSEQHGPDKVRARDGHLAGEIGLKLGGFGKSIDKEVFLDTELVRDSSFSGNILMIGGVLTNTVTKKFNNAFPASFEGEDFPYREIKTPESTYNEDTIGVVAKTENPHDSEGCIIMVAGVRNSGTRAAVLAFKNLEDILDDYTEGEFYRVVRGLDLNGDGEVDDFEVVE